MQFAISGYCTTGWRELEFQGNHEGFKETPTSGKIVNKVFSKKNMQNITMQAPLFVGGDIRILEMREHVCICGKNNPFDALNIPISTTVCIAYIPVIDYLCDIS